MDYFIASNTTHNLRFLHRIYKPVIVLSIRHEITNIQSVISNLDCELVNGYSLLQFDYDFKLGGSYEIEITSGNDLVYRSKAKAV